MDSKKTILHLLSVGSTGGIEKMIYSYSRISSLNHIFVFLFAKGEYFERLEKNNIVYFVDCKQQSFQRTIQELREIVKKHKIDIIVSQHANGYLRFISMIIRHYTNDKKYIVYAHSDAIDQLDRRKTIKSYFINLLNYVSVKKADGIIAISSFVGESMKNVFKVNSSKIRVIYNGVDIESFMRIDYIPFSNHSIELVYVGRLAKIKGVQTIIEAVNKLDSNYHLTVIGDGPYRANLEKMVVNTNMVTFCGNVENVCDLIYDKDIFIHMPKWNEGFGNSVVEAMASGKICIVANKGAIGEIIDNGVNGYIINDTVQDLIDAIKAIKYNQRLIDSAREKANVFGVKTYANNLDNYFEYFQI